MPEAQQPNHPKSKQAQSLQSPLATPQSHKQSRKNKNNIYFFNKLQMFCKNNSYKHHQGHSYNKNSIALLFVVDSITHNPLAFPNL